MGRKAGVLFPVAAVFFRHRVQTGSGAHPASYRMVVSMLRMDGAIPLPPYTLSSGTTLQALHSHSINLGLHNFLCVPSTKS